MKKSLLLIFAFLCILPAFSAEGKQKYKERDLSENGSPFKYEMRFGWGGWPVVDEAFLIPSGYYTGGNYALSTPATIYESYSGPVYMTGLISAEISFIIKKWLTFSVGLTCNGLWGSVMDGETMEPVSRNNGISATLLPQVRFTYLSKEYVKLYSSVGLGLMYGYFDDEQYFIPCFQTAPLGIMVGRKFFVFAEACVGMLNFGGNVGLGFRF